MTDTVQKPDRSWDVLCHLAALSGVIGVPFGHIIGPLVVWLIKRGDSPSVDRNGKESLNFQISVMLYVLVALSAAMAMLVITLGLLWIFIVPMLIAMFVTLQVVELIFIVIAAVKVGNGEEYRYPLTLRLIS